VSYSLEDGRTAAWDSIFGERWDVVARGDYVVTSMTFKKVKFQAPHSWLEKLKCKLTLMNLTISSGDEYRAFALERMLDRLRNPIEHPAPSDDGAPMPNPYTPSDDGAPMPNPYALHIPTTDGAPASPSTMMMMKKLNSEY
jgi:hypothetical protein